MRLWTAAVDFEAGAKRLVEVFQSIMEKDDKKQTSNLERDGGGLLDWSVVIGRQDEAPGGGLEMSFLQHAPRTIKMSSPRQDFFSSITPPVGLDSKSIDDFLTDESDGLQFLIDDSILCDPDVASSFTKNNVLLDDQRDAATTATTTTTSSSLVEWSFSVVYSDTWQVPVLYFHVQYQCSHDDDNDSDTTTTTPCSRSMVVEMLSRVHHQNIQMEQDDDNEDNANNIVNNRDNNVSCFSSWDFVSSDEHPVTGLPCFFLHPCRTRDRVEILLNTIPSTTTTTTTTTKTPSTSLTNDAEKSDKQQQQQHESVPSSESSDLAMLLLIWMSLILPSVGHGFSAKTFARVMAKLKEA
jgi:Autophagocytosis associated protein, active-site domain